MIWPSYVINVFAMTCCRNVSGLVYRFRLSVGLGCYLMVGGYKLFGCGSICDDGVQDVNWLMLVKKGYIADVLTSLSQPIWSNLIWLYFLTCKSLQG